MLRFLSSVAHFVFLITFASAVSATSFLNPDVRLVGSVANSTSDIKWSWPSQGDYPNILVRNYVYIQKQNTLTFTEIDQNMTQAQICDTSSGWWEEFRYDQEFTPEFDRCVLKETLSGELTSYEYCRDGIRDILLYAGTVKTENYDTNTCASDPVCNSLYSYCGLDPQEEFGTFSTISGNSNASLQVDCSGTYATGTLYIVAFTIIKNEAGEPSGGDIQINGSLPASFTMSRTYYDNGSKVYIWEGTMNWDIRVDQPCGSTISLSPSANGYAEIYLPTIDLKQKNIKIVVPENDSDFDLIQTNHTATQPINYNAHVEPVGGTNTVDWNVAITYRTSGGKCEGCDVTQSFQSAPDVDYPETHSSMGGQVTVNASAVIQGETVTAEPVIHTIYNRGNYSP